MFHVLKTDHPVYEALVTGIKNYEIRFNDRNFQVGDILELHETLHTHHERVFDGKPLVYTGRFTTRVITHVLKRYGLKEGWVILNVAKLEEIQKVPKVPTNPYSGGVAKENWQRGFEDKRFIGPKGSSAHGFYIEGIQARLDARASVTPTPAHPGKYDEVLRPFLVLMERELHANRDKGDRPGWLAMTRKTALLEIWHHVGKLQRATLEGSEEGIREHAADVANMAMMLVDVCGYLVTLPTEPQAESK